MVEDVHIRKTQIKVEEDKPNGKIYLVVKYIKNQYISKKTKAKQ